jgi:predicted transcriptional regulator
MDAVYRLGKATAAEVRSELPDPPGYSAVRATMRILGDKGHLRHTEVGPRYVYSATVPARRLKRSAAERYLETFFAGSVSQAVATLLDVSDVGEEELAELSRTIEQARKEGK